MDEQEALSIAKEIFDDLNETDSPEMCKLLVVYANEVVKSALDSQEPVAWTKIDDTGFVNKPYRAKANAELHYGKDNLTPLYTSPQAQNDLQDKEIQRLRGGYEILRDCSDFEMADGDLARRIANKMLGTIDYDIPTSTDEAEG